MKYHTHARSGRGTVIRSIGQPIKFVLSISGRIAHLIWCSEDPPWHNGHNQTDIAEFGPMSTKFWFTMAQLYREIAIMYQDFVLIGPKPARLS